MPGPALPDREEGLIGKSLAELTEGSEPFNGWFGKQADGKVRMLTGIPFQAGMIVEIHGLESIRRFQGPAFQVDQAALVRAELANATRAATAAQPKQFTLKRFSKPPTIDGSLNDWPGMPAFDIRREGFPGQARVRLAYDGEYLYLLFHVTDTSPWINRGKRFARLFKTGDAVDLQVSSTPNHCGAESPDSGDIRLLFAPFEGNPTCVLMKPVDKAAPSDKAYTYRSPVGQRQFDRVELLSEAQIAVEVEDQGYWLEAAVPLRRIGLSPAPDLVVRGDAGFISSNAQGTMNTARTYWSNQVTNLTSDEPSEAWLYPATWGEWKFE
jgi:hypothetical protein